MKIDDAIVFIIRTIKGYKSHLYITCTPLLEEECNEVVKLFGEKQKEGYNYIFRVHDGRKDENGFRINSFVLTFEDVDSAADIKAQNYFQIDDKYSDLLEFIDLDFWYTYCLDGKGLRYDF